MTGLLLNTPTQNEQIKIYIPTSRKIELQACVVLAKMCFHSLEDVLESCCNNQEEMHYITYIW